MIYQSLSGIIGFVCEKNFCFIGHGWNSNTFLSRKSSEYLWVIDNKFGKCYSDINLFCQICLLWIIVWSVVDR